MVISSHLKSMDRLIKLFGANESPGKVVNIPIKVDLKKGAWISGKKQYPLRKEAVEGVWQYCKTS